MNNNNNELIVKPDYIFEVSWEVCNKVGGIYTVLSTKYPALNESVGNNGNVIMIGPDIWKETSPHPDFEEDPYLFNECRKLAADEGLFFRAGRWKVAGKPIAILIDFTTFFPKKDKIFAWFWEKYKLDSLTGQWDYIEPAIFGYAAGKVIEHFYRCRLTMNHHVVAQFHEWMTGTGILYLREKAPRIALAFTTHATALGRSIAGNGFPLYANLENEIPANRVKEFGIQSKYSLEKNSAHTADVFTTVSTITAEECKYLLKKTPDVVTPNGFDDSFVPSPDAFSEMRSTAREQILKVAHTLTGKSFSENTFLVLNSGRYEFKNKGIDLFIDSLAALNEQVSDDVIAIIAVPAGNHGCRQDLLEALHNNSVIDSDRFVTHSLADSVSDPVMQRIRMNQMTNDAGAKVTLLFVPVYLDGNDGIFNLKYYHFLTAFDLTVFPSYYEPWGYTPLESMAFGIPTITTTLAGYGKWINDEVEDHGNGAYVVKRTDDNDEAVIKEITSFMAKLVSLSEEEKQAAGKKARAISETALWKNFVHHYFDGYAMAINAASERSKHLEIKKIDYKVIQQQPVKPQADWKKLLVKTVYPEKIKKLHILAHNLWWSWNSEAIDLFVNINPVLWVESQHNPVRMLAELNYDELNALANDEEFITSLEKVYQQFIAAKEKTSGNSHPSVAYFSMEYGLHDSLKIYSGGLGVLAGDYLKEASDSGHDITAVGLLYRYGYFTQHISVNGQQVPVLTPQKFSHMPLQPVRDDHGEWITIVLALPGRNMVAKVWLVEVGKIKLYLLDTDIDENVSHDRNVTHQLYGGDLENRFKQELLLGVGGIRLLNKLGVQPDIYHCNEGHAAFINFERIRYYIEKHRLSFDEALSVVRSTSLFTTHTPVPAGHDRFPEDMLRAYIRHYPERMHIDWDRFIGLGRIDPQNSEEKFSMSVLAIRCSREVNGVSKIHEKVSRKMFAPMYEGYFEEEISIGHVTNGVHYPTWCNTLWKSIHKEYLGEGFEDNHHNHEYWQRIEEIPDSLIWETRNQLRTDLIRFIKAGLTGDMTHRQESPKHIVKVIETLDPNALTIGFARRFATYKRATLLFSNEERLAAIVNNPERPIQLIFSGKAHPKDMAGQELIKQIIVFSRKPEFTGKIVFLEDYDMSTAAMLVQSCDVWLNTPTRPMEASGTSGEKAAMNGVLNLSVLDGWWAEGYIRDGGWALPEEKVFENQELQDQLDAETIYNILEDQIAPIFYDRNNDEIPVEWVKRIKNSFKEIASEYTMKRMLHDYDRKYYQPLAKYATKLSAENFKVARSLTGWMNHVRMHWNTIEVLKLRIPDSTKRPLNIGEVFSASVELKMSGITHEDIGIELVFGQKTEDIVESIKNITPLKIEKIHEDSVVYSCEFPATRSGVFDYAFRIFPKHDLLKSRMDFPLVKWI